MTEFRYDFNLSYEDNFLRWWDMNSKERESWNEPRLDWEAAEKLFGSLVEGFKERSARYLTRRTE